MMQAVLFVIVMIALLGWPSSVYLLQQQRGGPLSGSQLSLIALCLAGASGLSIAIWLGSMRFGRPRAPRHGQLIYEQIICAHFTNAHRPPVRRNWPCPVQQHMLIVFGSRGDTTSTPNETVAVSPVMEG